MEVGVDEDEDVRSVPPVTKPTKRTPSGAAADTEPEDGEGEESVRPARKVSKSTPAPIIAHKTPCTGCAGRKEGCRGREGRTCLRCEKLKAKCSKSLGRGGRWQVEETADAKGKGKAPGA